MTDPKSNCPKAQPRYEGRFNLYRAQSPGQTLGPFFHQGLLRGGGDPFVNELKFTGSEGTPLSLQGRVLDGLGRPVGDAMLEVWQADPDGVYAHPTDPRCSPEKRRQAFRGFGRTSTSPTGEFSFHTSLPGAVPGPRGSEQAPHLNLIVGARGMMRHVFTRVYFEGDPKLALDPVLQSVPQERQPTLLATSTGDHSFLFDIHLQGPKETVFFDV